MSRIFRSVHYYPDTLPSILEVFFEEFIDCSLEVRSQGWNVVNLLQTSQFVDVHLDLVFLARLLELFLVDIIAADGVSFKQDDVVLVSSFKVARHKNLFHYFLFWL
jgi:hypothetical protein